ncbi:NAD-dependent epimerase/dehydratase family protein [Bifidobacterium thermophilum]|uniref:NAD-dependent epimerase/dehydratase family protein n=1 Tax=Bifidobacterium thermophilum TaxID=33905 RepID=UPI00309F9AE9
MTDTTPHHAPASQAGAASPGGQAPASTTHTPARIVLLGGNGYIGRAVTREWLARDPDALITVLCGSGHNELNDPRVTTIKADIHDRQAVSEALPTRIDYIADFIGGPRNDPDSLRRDNDEPADTMLQIARQRKVKAMGFIGGTFGPKTFVSTKRSIIERLRREGSPIPLAVVEPTVVYGAGRHDAIARAIPLLKFCGLFNHSMRPMRVENVARTFVDRMLAAGSGSAESSTTASQPQGR